MEIYKSFETERLLLKPTSLEDAEFILNIFNSPKWLKYIGDRNVRNLEEAKKYISDKMISQLERLGFSNYTIIRKNDSTKIGLCGLYDRPGMEGIDLGFALLTEYENNGYAFEAANKIKSAATDDFGLTKLQAITAKDNLSSQKLLEKLNFKFTTFITLPNSDEEIMLYNFSFE